MQRSLVIPMYNEVGRIESTLTTLAQSPLAAGIELVLVDDGSTDGTPEVAERVAKELGITELQVAVQPRNRGKGAAVRAGMLAATGAIRVFVDADLSVTLGDLERCFRALEDGADVVYGTRAHPDSSGGRSQPMYRVLSGRTFNALLRVLRLTTERDTQCGLKGFRADAAQAVFSALTTDRFAFDVEALARATRAGYRVEAIPVTWAHVEASRVHALRDGVDMARAALAIRWRLRGERAGRVTADVRTAGSPRPRLRDELRDDVAP